MHTHFPGGRALALGLTWVLVVSGCASRPPRLGLRAMVSGAVPPSLAAHEARSATATCHAAVGAAEDVSASLHPVTNLLVRLETEPERLLDRANGLFVPYVEYATRQREWLSLTLGSVHRLVHLAAQAEDPDMQRALLRLAGPRLEAALSGTQLLAAWVDHLNLTEAVLRQCPYYGLERMVRETDRLHKTLVPAMTALASLEPERLEATASALPELMRELTQAYEATREGVRLAARRHEQILMAQQLMETLVMVSAMKLALPRLPPAAPISLGVGLVMGSDGMMLGSRVVVSAEWVERMRLLVQAGVLSAPAVGAAVRIQAGQVLMSQGSDELPKGVREALGEGPEVRGMRQTGRAGAGMAESPRHHVLPREHREWFEQRGFTGELDIDQFCVRMERASHEALHGGGDWRLGRTWPGEWNQMIMKALREAETELGRRLTRSEILNIVAERMKDYGLPLKFLHGRGR